ncbi:MAG: ferredoxin reductase family protein [Spirochaetia bacterium]
MIKISQAKSAHKRVFLFLYFSVPLAAVLSFFLLNSGILSDPLYALSAAGGIFGFTWLMFQFILSSRHRAVEWGIGLDRLLKLHRIMGVVIVLLLLPHVIVRLIVYPLSLQILFGSLAFVGLIGVGIFSSIFFTSPRFGLSYEKVKLLHNGTFLLSLLAALHIALSSAAGGVSSLSVYFLALGLLGLGAYVYRKIASPKKARAHPWTVKSVKEIADDHVEVHLAGPSGLRHSRLLDQRLPGQFAYFRFFKEGLNEEHPFTISSYGKAGLLSFTAKKVGDFTSRLPAVSPGDTAAVEGPFGVFSYRAMPDAAEKPLVAIVGGIGITPFLAMFQALRLEPEEKRPPKALLYWAARTPEYFVHRSFFEEFENEWGDFSFHPSTGLLDMERLYRQIVQAGAEEGNFFLCGPPKMMETVSRSLRAHGVEKRRIITERFSV